MERVFVFSTDRQPGIFVDVGQVYDNKMAACMAHRSQFPKGAESLEWMKAIDRRQAERIDAAYAESFKQITVW